MQEEYFDILDLSGQKTGQKKLRHEVHRDGDWHGSVDVWILNSQGELLLQKRASIKESHPDKWETSCSGHISAGDESLPSAIRELEEELGVIEDPQSLELIFSLKERNITNNGTFVNNEFKDVYLLRKDLDITTLKLQTEEVSTVKFVHFAELEELISKHPSDFVPHQEIYQKLFAFLKEERL